MPNHRSGLATRMDQEMSKGGFRIILLNAAASFDETTDLAQILQYECLQASGGYQSYEFSYTAGSSFYDADRDSQRTPEVIAPFAEVSGGTGYDFTHIALWQGRGATSNKAISSVNASTDQITCLAHGLVDGSRAFVRSTGTLPGGLTVQRYFVKRIDADTIELYTNADLASGNKANITSAGTGSLRLQYADGVLYTYDAIVGTINAGAPKSFTFFYELQ